MTVVIQSIYFTKPWSIITAGSWLRRHNLFPIKPGHKTQRFLRYRFHDPKYFDKLRTKKLGNGIYIVWGIEK